MGDLLNLLKNGNKPSLLAAIVNTVIALLKGGAFFFTGNVAMFAEMMHSIGDAANQFFVYIGSSLSKKAPTPRFPNGFGRLVNLVCLGAVIIVGILSYETIIEGWHHIQHPTESSGVAITLSVLAIAIILEFVVLYKAGKEILHEVGIKGTMLSPLTTSFANLGRAKPATKLVFMEDLVATSGGILAFVAVLISHFTGFLQAEGIASIMIGIMMFYVVGKVFLDNARGALGETDEQMLVHIAHLVSENQHVKDIQKLEVIKEGEYLHVEIIIEIDPQYTFAEVDDIRDNIKELILSQQGVTDITISFDEDDGIRTWTQHKDQRTVLKTRN
ncbi:cation diffusion facilitator family transporter [Psychrobacillus sp. OK028]|uniref:cation diffusion facilitator family transporter n=1 Tax=Psychrobacillus sp. OK028 TaxID=1884359 RepID=UPI00088EBAE2|nr:cation diffusion facilitator family transporter [Psychrobacillus sp. OK028]SDN97980.1 cation diffusion facilitator family transporter [Psychrobacillus sp. OK028]